MTIISPVSAQLARPQTFHVFTYSFAVPGLASIPLRVALIGMKSSLGTATAGTIYEATDPVTTDALFGPNSELALMCRKAYDTAARLQAGPRIFAVAIIEPAGGVARVQTITGTGAASADGPIVIRISGRPFSIGVRNGDSANTIATAIANAFKVNAENLPVSVTVATNVVTLTHPTKGVNGQDVTVTVDQQVPGNTQVVAQSAAGTGVADPQPALDALAPIPFDGLALGNHAAADITEINADIAARWNYAEKRWRWYFIGEMGTIGTATTLATAANHQAVLVCSMEGCLNTAGEMAAALCIGAFSRTRPNANYDGLKLPLYPPAAAVVYTPTEVETAIAAGLTPLTAQIDPFTRTVADGVARVERMITTKTTQTTIAGTTPFVVLRDLAVSRTGVFIAQQVDIAYGDRFNADADPDGTLLTDDVILQVKDMIEGILRLAGDPSTNILRNVEADIAKLKCERDPNVSGRLLTDISYTTVVGLHQIANNHRVQI